MKEKTEIILPLYYFPNIVWWKRYLDASKVYFVPTQRYEKQTFRNRMEINTAQGKLTLSIPIARYAQGTTFENIVAFDKTWQRHHWKSIYNSYRKSALFEFYEADLQLFYEQPFTHLQEINLKSIEWMMQKLGIESKHEIVTHTPENLIFYDESPRIASTMMPELPCYVSVFEPYIPNLSGLDALFCAGKSFFSSL